MLGIRKQAERIARETGGDVNKIEHCLRESCGDKKDYGVLDAIVDVITAPVCGGTAVIRSITEKK